MAHLGVVIVSKLGAGWRGDSAVVWYVAETRILLPLKYRE